MEIAPLCSSSFGEHGGVFGFSISGKMGIFDGGYILSSGR